jgi:hypothetical protein
MNDQLMRGREIGIQQAQQNLDASAQEQQINQQAASMFQTLAKGGSVTSPASNNSDTVSSPAEAFDKVASNLLAVGAPKKALEYFNAAGKLRDSQNKAINDQLTQQKSQADLLAKQADFMGRDLGGATNLEEWNQGIAAMQQQADAGLFPQATVDQYKAIPFTPEAAAHIRDAAMSVKDKASLDMQAARIAAQDNRDASADAYRKARLAQEQQKIESAKTAKDKATKTGALASAPTPAQVREAEGVVSSLVFDNNAPTKPKAGTTSQSYQAYMAGVTSIASQAQQMMQDNRGLTRQEALNRAVLLSKAEGDWDIHTEEPSAIGKLLGSDAETSVRYNSAGKQPEDAIPAPVADGKIDPSGLKVGRWYTHGDTKFKYDGNGKISVLQ